MWVRLDGQGPLYRQLYRALRHAIGSGALPTGGRLPSTRALAAELGLSRTTVLLAYDQLVAEGYIEGRRGAGHFVEVPAAPAVGGEEMSRKRGDAPPRLSRFGAWLSEQRLRPLFSAYAIERPALPYDFRYGVPAIADFPLEAWQRCLRRRTRRAPLRAYEYGHPQGSPGLRRALSEYLRRGRGLTCDPNAIVLLNGSQQGLDLTARLLLDAGDLAVVEEPGYEGARRAFEAAGARLVFAGVDDRGLDPQSIGLSRARLAHVTPSHQYPLGGVMPYARRLALLDWAARAGAYVVEDDYDGEYRFENRPLEALAALDSGGRVLYLGTFSKVMFPALRVGYVVLPEGLVEPFTRARLVADGGTSPVLQEALADFITEGGFERHVRRSRARNRERRAALIDAVGRHLGDRVEVEGANAGLHIVVWFRAIASRQARHLARAAAAGGVGIYPVEPYYRNPPRRAGFVLGYSALTPREIHTGIARLARVLEVSHRSQI